MISDCC